MPLSYEIDEEHRLVITTGCGTVSAEEAIRLQHDIRSAARLNADLLHLVDLTRITSINVDINVMSELATASIVRHIASRIRCWIEQARVRHGSNVCRAAQSDRREEMRIFVERNEALLWLGITPFD